MFQKCDICSKKPGSPLLCAGCLYNRQRVQDLETALRAAMVRENQRAAAFGRPDVDWYVFPPWYAQAVELLE